VGRTKIGRNDPCPCGSGKKFKRCHGIAGVTPLRPPQPKLPWPGSNSQRQSLEEVQQLASDPSNPLTRVNPLGFDDDKTLWMQLSFSTSELWVEEGGLPLSDSEDIIIPIPFFFPWTIRFPLVDHDRFVGHAHVLLGQHLCIYLDPSQEWHQALGISGYLERLWSWLSDAAAGKFDPSAALFHPVGGVPYRTEGCPAIVVRERLDLGNHAYRRRWLRERGPTRLDLVAEAAGGDLEAPVIALPGPLSYGAGTTLADLGENLDRVKRGAAKEFMHHIDETVRRNPEGTPQYFILAVPRPKPRDSEDVHLIAGRVPPDAADRLRGANPKEEPTDIFRQETAIEWSQASEERPTRTIRRDARRPVGVYQGKRVVLWGCGGLGSWIGEFLARAGVQQIELSDPGIVMGGLLVRQNYQELDIGDRKAAALQRRLIAINERADFTLDAHGFTKVLVSRSLPNCDLVIDATIDNGVSAAIKEVWTSTKNRPLVARVSTDRASSTLGLMTISRPGVGPTIDELDDEAGKMVREDAALEPFRVFWDEPSAGDEVVPEPGCSIPTFHGSAADLAAIAGVLVSLLGAHLGTNTPGTHLSALPHGPGASIPHCWIGEETE
jgi:hypothetical protein